MGALVAALGSLICQQCLTETAGNKAAEVRRNMQFIEIKDILRF